MSEIVIHSSLGDVVCKPFELNRDTDVEETPIEEIPLPETEVSD